MFPSDLLAAYIAAVLLVIISPGPDNVLAVSRGLSQGRLDVLSGCLDTGPGKLFECTARS